MAFIANSGREEPRSTKYHCCCFEGLFQGDPILFICLFVRGSYPFYRLLERENKKVKIWGLLNQEAFLVKAFLDLFRGPYPFFKVMFLCKT